MSNDVLSRDVLELVESLSPKSVNDLVNEAEKRFQVSREDLIKLIIELNNDGLLVFHQENIPTPSNFRVYLFTSRAFWFWLAVLLSFSTGLVVLFIPENAYPLVIIRYLLGSVFVLFLPGFCLIKTLYPWKEVDNVERIVLSVGTSLAIVPFVGLLLNYTLWGIRLVPVTFGSIFVTLLLALTGVYREYDVKRRSLDLS